MLNFSVSASPGVINLASAGAPVVQSAGYSNQLPPTGTIEVAPSAPLNPSGFVGRWIDIYADGVDVGIVCGETSASVSSANAPVLATTGTTVATAGQCWRLTNGTTRTYFVTPNAQFMGVVGSGSGTLRIALSSR